MARPSPYVIGIPVYHQVDLLDVAVPLELFGWMGKLEAEADYGARERVVRLISLDGPSVLARGGLPLGQGLPSVEEAGPVDLLWVPGADPARLCELMLDLRLMTFLRRQGALAQYTASVCSGALLLAAAGLLDGYRATTHWALVEGLKRFPRIEVAAAYPRYVIDRRRITGGGITSGIDEALMLISLISGEVIARKVQLKVQYNPCPPFHDGDPSVSRLPIHWKGQGSVGAVPGLEQAIDALLARA